VIYGEPDGHGRYGVLSTDQDGALICHECGVARQSLGRHVREHGLTAAQYRADHGLGRSTGLVTAELSAKHRKRASDRVGTAQWQRFAERRDPDAARRESLRVFREEALRPAVVEVRRKVLESDALVEARRGRRNTAVHACEVCGAQWCVVRVRAVARRTCSDTCFRKLRGWPA